MSRDHETLPGYLSASSKGVVIEIVVAPRAKRSKLVGMHGGFPKIALAAPPIEGRANNELVSFLRELFGVPRSHIELLRGDSSKRKVLLLRGLSPERVRAELEKSGKGD